MDFRAWAATVPDGATVLLDIDGTLAPSGADSVGVDITASVQQLAQRCQIYLFSNKRSQRTKVLAAHLGVLSVDSRHRKPDPRVLRGINRSHDFFVVGDKIMTDGLLALLVGAEFVRISRITDDTEGRRDKLFNLIDDAALFVWRYARLLRPLHWVKNLLVFAPLFFGGEFLSLESFLATTMLFVAFSLTASAGYVVNDIIDAERDRLHARKRRRPIASREISVVAGILFASAVAATGLGIAAAIGWMAIAITAAYGASSMVYSLYVKRIPILEMLMFVWFYLARLLGGAVAAGVMLSSWIILAIVFLSLFLVVAKRHAQVMRGEAREVLAHYPQHFLEGLLLVSAAMVLAFYGLYTVIGMTHSFAVYTLVPVLGGILRYLQLVYQENGVEYPEVTLTRDLPLVSCVAIWFIMMILIFYHQ